MSHWWDTLASCFLVVNRGAWPILQSMNEDAIVGNGSDGAEPGERSAWVHGEVIEISEVAGFSPPGGEGFLLRPLVAKDGEMPSLLLGTLEPGGSIPREIHETAREHLLVLEGEVVYVADDGTQVVLRPGQMGKLATNTWHTVRNRAQLPARFLVSLS